LKSFRRPQEPARGRRYVALACLALGIISNPPPLRAFQADGAAVLAPLEARIAADPDNLRAGSEYRQAVIRLGAYDRAIQFFEQLVMDHPSASNARLNFGFAYVDKIPVAGSITQVILANNALNEFTKSVELRAAWIALYTRGNSYLYWPKIFGRASLGVADLELAMQMQKADRKRSHHVRTYIALGDGHWKMDDLDKARAVWAEGLMEFPENAHLKARLSKSGDDLKAVMDDFYDITKRIDTSLEELWAE
jgi:tetratricopeptide (TPR) repeat protein